MLIAGFVMLIKGADFFVDGASATAQNLKVSKVLIGLTIVAFGTSAPEFAVSITALAKGSTDMLLGNVIGSNITNSLLILGVAAVLCPIAIKQNTVKKELPLCSLISTLLVVLFLDNEINHLGPNTITRSDAFVIIMYFAVFVYYIISVSRNKIDDDEPKSNMSTFKAIIITIIGLVGIVLGSNFVVNSATDIASRVGMSERLISLTIIAFGTSLPELVTTIVSAVKKEQDILVGNIIGSNIFNICMVLGIPVALFGGITPASFEMIDLAMLFISSLVLFYFSVTDKRITRVEGLILLLLYMIYYIFIFII